jgi:hypothetical protein
MSGGHGMKKILSICMMITAVTIFGMATDQAKASDSDVPRSLLSSRDRLVGARQDLLATEAEQNRCLKEDEATIKEIDSALLVSYSKARRDALASGRAERVSCINSHHKVLAVIDENMVAVDKDLVWVESQINGFACMK